jgi:hypothetical protein
LQFEPAQIVIVVDELRTVGLRFHPTRFGLLKRVLGPRRCFVQAAAVLIRVI